MPSAAVSPAEREPARVAPAICTLVRSAKTVEVAPVQGEAQTCELPVSRRRPAWRAAIMTIIGIASSSRLTSRMASSPMANATSGSPSWTLSREMSINWLSCNREDATTMTRKRRRSVNRLRQSR
eukprot:scaffold90631_cov69-Phaeocystis_antarctica.AAC.3